ncbi:MAG: hypothetical protein JST30_09525 [Armatimonadetes bacterium]|nr:hypothetical protein [Armatimonadota bacterium]
MSLLVAAAAISARPDARALDAAFFDDLSKKAVRYFCEQSGPQTGFTLDRERNQNGESGGYNVASIASTGFALSAYAIAAERGWMTRKEAVSRVRTTLRSVQERAPKEHGWYYHWLDWKTGERQWQSEVSTIDTGIFLCGMIVAEQALRDKEVTARSGQILKAVEWKWALTDGGARPAERFIGHGWKPETGFLESRWAGYCELPLLYVLAYGGYPDMPQDSWAKIKKPIVTYRDREFFVGGSIFLHVMSHVFVDFKGLRDPEGFDYWVSSRNAVLANRDYCSDNPKGMKGYSSKVWGLSASDGPEGYRAYGAPGWIDDDGTLAPSSTVACVMFAPDQAYEGASAIRAAYPRTLGRYGFTIAFNPTKDWQSPDVIGIDLGQMLLAVQNAKDDIVHKWFMSHPLVKKGVARIGLRATKEGDATRRPLRVVPR